jgi:hypothetical protein
MTVFDWLLESLAAALLVVTVVSLLSGYAALPETVPTHFGASGAPDDTGRKATLLLLPGVHLFLYVLLTAIAPFPWTFNFPWKITSENAPRQYRLAQLLVRSLKAELGLLLAYLTVQSIRVAHGAAAGLGVVFLPLVSALLFGTVAVYFVLAARSR